MFGWKSVQAVDAEAMAAALQRSMAVIEFKMDGTIVAANDKFLATLGYTLGEIQGRHHGMFVAADERVSAAYREFWSKLNSGEFQAGAFKRIGKSGKDVWIQASYNPIFDSKGKPIKVIKIAADVTAQKIASMEDAGQIVAIGRSQAVIRFNLDGTIVTANPNFLKVTGYALDEIKGKHHSMFVASADRNGAAYRDFWAKLNRGEFRAGEYKRIGKGGKEVWILATYNPIVDEKGRPFGIVKFASDITNQKLKAADSDGQIAAIQTSQAVIEFKMDGTIITANPNFLNAVGYALGDVQGRHHSMFVSPSERDSEDYKAFWKRLNEGQYQAGEYQRVGKGGRDVWIEASYNPILDLNGKPFKVVKYASDVTQKALTRMRAERARSLIHSVASGSEQMTASIREISETMSKSRETTGQVVIQASAASEQAGRLNSAAQAMEGIVDLIGSMQSPTMMRADSSV